MHTMVTSRVNLGEHNNEDAMVSEVQIGEGTVREIERWPFSRLKRGNYFEVKDLEDHAAVRSAATRAKKRYKRHFSVRKVTVEGKQVIRVYRP
jgi:hypothetical protein